ncbi:MAG: S4 domain-containing protein, partial [Candidatus Zixiibacteriota bacterium]
LIRIKKELEEKKINPMVLKKRLGKEIVRMYSSEAEAEKVCQEFERVFSKKELPEEIPVKHLEHDQAEMWVGHYLVQAGCAKSTSEVKRLIKQGGLYIDNERVADEDLKISLAGEKLVRLGKRRFFRIVGKVRGG